MTINSDSIHKKWMNLPSLSLALFFFNHIEFWTMWKYLTVLIGSGGSVKFLPKSERGNFVPMYPQFRRLSAQPGLAWPFSSLSRGRKGHGELNGQRAKTNFCSPKFWWFTEIFSTFWFRAFLETLIFLMNTKIWIKGWIDFQV